MKKWNKIIVLALIFIVSPLVASPKVVLVLGSGGSKALAHVGVIEELEELGIIPDAIVGCSSGAIVGALYAQYRDIKKVKKILIDLKYDDLIDFTFFQKYAISSSKKLEKFLQKHLKVDDFSSLQVQFVAVATDLQKGEPVYFKEGALLPAILASTALPGLFPPCKIENQIYVDGGITDPLPVSFARKLGEKVIVIASDIRCSLDELDADNISQVIGKSFEVLYQRLAFFERQEADILLEMNLTGALSPIEDTINKEMYQRGREVVRNHAEELLNLISVSK